MPLLLLGLLVKSRPGKGIAEASTSQVVLSQATWVLSKEYEPFSHYWEVLELVRRLLISAVMLAIPATYAMMRLIVALVTCFVYLILLFTVRPFKRLDDTIVAAAANTLLVFTFITAIFINVHDGISDSEGLSDELGTKIAIDVLGFNSTFDISMTLIGLGFAQVFIVVTVIAIKLKRVVDAATLQQHSRNLERTLRAIQSTKLLRHPAVFITYESLRRQGRIPSHEDARASGELHVVDTWEMLLQFVDDEATLFVSHQW